jgi:hypothetical protein
VCSHDPGTLHELCWCEWHAGCTGAIDLHRLLVVRFRARSFDATPGRQLSVKFGASPAVAETTSTTSLPYICEVDVPVKLVGAELNRTSVTGTVSVLATTQDPVSGASRSWQPLCSQSTAFINAASSVVCRQLGYASKQFVKTVAAVDYNRFVVSSCTGSGMLHCYCCYCFYCCYCCFCCLSLLLLLLSSSSSSSAALLLRPVLQSHPCKRAPFPRHPPAARRQIWCK